MDNILWLLEQTGKDSTVRKSSEEKLLQLEKENPLQFSNQLLAVIANKQVNSNLRFVAIIFLKNMISRLAENASENIEPVKVLLRESLPFLLPDENFPQISLQISLSVAKLISLDYPTRWPNAFGVILQLVHYDSLILRARALQFLHFSMKNLGTSDLGYESFSKIAPQVFKVILSVYQSSISSVLNSYKVSDITALLEVALMSHKVLGGLFLRNFINISDAESISLIQIMLQHSQTIINLLVNKEPIPFSISKHIEVTSKLALKLQDEKDLEFLPLVKSYFNFFSHNLRTKQYVSDRFVIPAMTYFHQLMTCAKYREPRTSDPQYSIKSEAQQLIASLINESFASEMALFLLENYLKISKDQIEEWEENPEGMVNEELRGAYQQVPNSCAEVLFSTIIHKFPKIVGPIVSKAVYSLSTLPTKESIFIKDSIYWALSLSYHHVHEQLPFSFIFKNGMFQDLSNPDPEKRIAQMIDSWVAGIPKDLQKQVIEALLSLMSASQSKSSPSDYPVRLWAAIALRSVIDEYEFEVDTIVPYMEPMTVQLIKLISESFEFRTSSELLNTIQNLSKRLKQKFLPFANAVIQQIAILWKREMKSPLLRCLQGIVEALGENCVQIGEQIVGAIKMGLTDTDINLTLKDTLSLWWEFLTQCPVSLTSEVSKLFPMLIQYVVKNVDSLEHVDMIMGIPYTSVLKDSNFLQNYGPQIKYLIEIVLSKCSELKVHDVVTSLKLLDAIVVLYGHEACVQFTNYIKFILEKIFENQPQSVAIGIYFLNSIAKFILIDADYFFQFIPSQDKLVQLIVIWLSKIDRMSDSDVLQSSALALSALIPKIGDPTFINPIVQVCIKSIEDRPYPGPFSSWEQHLRSKDPTVVLSVQTFALSKLGEIQFANVDSNLLKILQTSQK